MCLFTCCLWQRCEEFNMSRHPLNPTQALVNASTTQKALSLLPQSMIMTISSHTLTQQSEDFIRTQCQGFLILDPGKRSSDSYRWASQSLLLYACLL